MTEPGRVHAGFGEPIVEPRRRPIAEVGADDLVDGREDLQEDERDADQREWLGQARAPLHGSDELAHGDREQCGQETAGDEDDPPGAGERGVRPGQDPEELPFFPGAETLQRHGHLDGQRG